MLLRVLYTSVIGDGVSTADVHRLVAGAQRRNRQLDLTGALLVCDGQFAQALEGQALAVEETMRRIAVDPRHHTLLVHQREVITRRLFSNWAMGLINDSRCDESFRHLRDGRGEPAEFLTSMAEWIDGQNLLPH